MSKLEEDLDTMGLKGSSKKKRAPLIGSARLTLFVIFLICTTNFILQRFSVNFAIVCMHRPLLDLSLLDMPDLTSSSGEQFDQFRSTRNGSDDTLSNVTTGDHHMETSSLIHGGFDTSAEGVVASNESTGIRSERIDFDTVSSNGQCGGLRRTNKGNMANSTEYFREFSWSKETKGSIIGAFYYGLTFSQIPSGWLVDKFGSKKNLIISQFLLSVLSVLSPISAKFGAQYFFAARFLQGVANGPVMPAIYVLASRWSADMERSFLMGIMSAGFGLAAAVVYPITAFFCENMGWEWSFYFYGGTGLLWCLVAYFLVHEWPENHPRIKMAELQFIQKHRAVQYGGPKREPVRVPWRAMLFSGPMWAFIITHFCMFWCFVTVSAYLPTYLSEVLGLDISENGLLSALPYVGMLIIHFSAAIVFDRLREKKICSLTVLRKSFNSFGMFVSAIAIGALGLINCNVAAAVVLLTVCQASLEIPFMGGYMFSIFDMAPKYASIVTSFSNTFGLLAGFISPAVVSFITTDGTKEQWVLVFYLTSGLMAFGGVVYLIFGKCTLLSWAADGGAGSTVVDGNGSLSRNNSKRVEQELKQLKIRLINGESDVKGQTVRS